MLELVTILGVDFSLLYFFLISSKPQGHQRLGSSQGKEKNDQIRQRQLRIKKATRANTLR